MHRWIVVVLLSGVLLQPLLAQRPTGFLDRAIVFQGQERRHQVYVPPGAAPEHGWPVILFLRGAGGRGADGMRPSEIGLGRAIRWHRDLIPAVVVFPQVTHADSFWAGADLLMALAALDTAIAVFGGDPTRQYLTGLSMGGFGTWRTAAEHPGRFAAIVPIAAGRLDPLPIGAPPDAADPYMEVATRVRHLPAWVFHGARDTITVRHARGHVDALRRLGADVRYTEYPEAGHDAWTAAYADPALWDWLFAQRRPDR